MDIVHGLVLHTPLWIYLLLFYLVARGVVSLKSRICSVNSLYVTPLIVFVISVSVLIESYPPFQKLYLYWCGALFIGMLVGWFLVSTHLVEADRSKHLVRLSGSSLSLVLVILFFIARYYFGYRLALQPELMQKSSFALTDMVISGIIAGIFIGRLLHFRYRYHRSPSVELDRRGLKM